MMSHSSQFVCDLHVALVVSEFDLRVIESDICDYMVE